MAHGTLRFKQFLTKSDIDLLVTKKPILQETLKVALICALPSCRFATFRLQAAKYFAESPRNDVED